MRIAAEHTPWYVADFETTSKREYERVGYTRVWLYSIADKNANIANEGTSIEEFMNWCENHSGSLIYFHNLKFDGSFIMYYLLSHAFPWENKLLVHSKRGFTTLIGDMGEFYQIKINFAPNKQVVIQDSLKIIPLKVKEIARAFNLPIQKEKIDYDDYTITPLKWEYVHHDVQIVAMGIKFFRDMGFTRMTIGSNSYNHFINNSLSIKRLFPLLDREWLNDWRSAYRGGRSQVNPLYAGKIIHNVHRYDINSMYPYTMAYCEMPYGYPIEMKTIGKWKFELYDIDIDFDIKEGHLPTLLKKTGLFSKGDSYYLHTDGIENIKISNVDLDLLKRHYNINYIKFNKIYGFKTSRLIFREFINHYYKLKSESEGGLRLVYKLIINNLYGKFGSKCKGRNKIPKLGDNDEIIYEYSEEHDMTQYYLPVAIAVVSWAHKLIDDAIMQTGYKNFVYCDTDSVHTLGTLPDDLVDNKILGKFKLEGTEEVSKYIRQKCYVYKENNNWNITCAGMPDSIKDFLINKYKDNVINEFKIGLVINEETEGISINDMKLAPKQVKGGCILQPVQFSLI